MKKTLTLLALILLFCACNKETSQVDPEMVNAGPGDIVLSLNSSALVEVVGKAVGSTPQWEKKLTDVHVFIVKRTKNQAVADGDKVVSHTAFGPTALEAKRMIISLSSALDDPNSVFTFYAIANDGSNSALTTIISGIENATRKNIIDLVESGAVGQYNGKYEETSIGSKRAKGFVMSGVDDNSGAGYPLDPDGPIKVRMEIKRTAVKLCITTAKSATFSTNYPTWTKPDGTSKTPDIKVSKIIIKEQLNNSNLFVEKSTVQSGNAGDIEQESSSNGSGLNLFYAYEQTTPIKLEVYADFALDGDFSNTAQDNLVKAGPYKIDLTGGTTNSAFVRNTCYNIKINLNGLSGNQISTEIDIQDWRTADDQEINIGK